jgi:hypothetical protein
MPNTKILFLDESGDHNLRVIDPKYPIFVLAGAIFESAYYEGQVKTRIARFKKKLFGTEDLILHTADMYRNRGGFGALKEALFRDIFYTELNRLIEKLDFSIVASGIHKSKHFERYGISAIDPYLLSLEFIVERFVFLLDEAESKGMIVAESRGVQLDNQLELAWLNLKIQGTRFLQPSRITATITDFKIVKKSEGVVGLEIADLVVSPIGRSIMKKETKEDFQLVKKKFLRNSSGHIRGHGLIVFPK